MPTTIPYDPALTIGNIVNEERLKTIEEVAQAQVPIDSAQDKLSAYLESKRSLDMTMHELIAMKVKEADLKPLKEELDSISGELAKAAAEYGKAKIDGERNIVEIKNKAALPKINDEIESPIDYNKTEIKSLPLGADSLKMDAQYFSFDSNNQSSEEHAFTLKSFVSGSTEVLGQKRSAELATSVQNQAINQLEQHNITGTLVITATCTHKNATVLAPFVLDVEKAIRVWNFSKTEKIKVDDPSELRKIAKEEGTNKEEALKIISGATYGSSFVGMVHVLNQTDTKNSQDMFSMAAGLQTQMEVGGWFSKAKGGFGVDSSFSNSVEKLLSTQNISSHVTLITMGVIPTIEAHQVQTAVKEFSEFSPDKMMGQLAKLNNSNADNFDSVAESAESARTGAQLESMKASRVESVVAAVGKIEGEANSMLDINSLMTAFTDYVEKVSETDESSDTAVGVPINYYIKPITRAQLAQMWVAKYYPDTFLSISGDDSEPSNDSGAKKTKKAKSEPAKAA